MAYVLRSPGIAYEQRPGLTSAPAIFRFDNFILHKAIIFDTHSLCRLYSATPQTMRCATVPEGWRTYTCLRGSPRQDMTACHSAAPGIA